MARPIKSGDMRGGFVFQRVSRFLYYLFNTSVMDECNSIYYNETYKATVPEVLPMKVRLALLIVLIALLLGGCGYWVVEDAPVQVAASTIQEG